MNSHGFDFAQQSDDPAGSDVPGLEPNWSSRQYVDHVEQSIWRCLACDSSESVWVADGSWECACCQGVEFYKANQPAKKLTSDGVWMFIPHGHSPEQPTPPSKAARRRKRRTAHPGGPSGSSVDGEFDAEEESLTHDPIVEPSNRTRSAVENDLAHNNHLRMPHHRNVQQRPVSNTGSQQNQLLEALRQLVTSKKPADDDWTSAAGPQRGVRWRGGAPPQPPVWRYDRDDLRAYSKFVKKVDIWKLQVAPYMTPKEMALALYNSLQGEAEQELEHTPISEIHCTDGVDKILAMLKGPMEQKVVYQKRKFLHEFENLRRYAGETMRAYINRFRRSQRCLHSVGIDVSLTYDDESMGARLLDRSGLSQEGQRMILVGTQQRLNFDLIVDTMLLQYPEFRGAPPVVGRDGAPVSKGSTKGSSSKGSRTSSSSMPSSHSSSSSMSTASSSTGHRNSFSGKGGNRRQVHFTGNDAANDNPEDEEFLDTIDEDGPLPDDQPEDDGDQQDDQPSDADENNDDLTDVADLAQVLTLTAKKLSNITLGRKFTNRPKPSPKTKLNAQDKATTHCTACGGLGHWHKDPECPRNGGPGGPAASTSAEKKGSSKGSSSKGAHKVGIIHHDYGSIEINHAPDDEYGNVFAVQMVDIKPYMVNDVNFKGIDLFKGYMIIDTGCQRTCCGKDWLNAHLHLLHQQHGLLPKMVKQHDEFQFGKGEPSISTGKAYLPSAISGVPLLLGTSVLDDNVPFLASNSLLTQLGAVMNLVNDTIYFERLHIETQIHRLGGHMALHILDFHSSCPSQMSAWTCLSKPAVWKNPHPEFILNPQVSRPGDLPNLRPDATASAVMVAEMAPDDHVFEECPQEHNSQHDDGHPPSSPTSRRDSGHPSKGFDDQQPSDLRTPTCPQVRKPSRKLRNMHGVPDQVEVERRSHEMGGSWAAKALVAIATIATAIFKHHHLFPTEIQDHWHHSIGESYIQEQSQGQADTSSSSIGFRDQRWMDNVRHGRARARSLEPSRTPGSHTDYRAGVTVDDRTTQLGRVRLPQRGDLSSRSRTDGTTIRSATVGPSHRHGCDSIPRRRRLRLGDIAMKSGNAKRLRGEWRRAYQVLTIEREIYNKASSTKDRPSPSADLWELFAGRALCTEMAAQCGLVALQPWDLIYGQDLMESSTRHEAFKVIKKFRPHLLMMGLECRHYTRFNRNLNYSHRLDEWYHLQQEDRPLLDLSADLAEQQHKEGRFFMLENPRNSEVWETDRLQRLLALPGVWDIVVDAGATIDDQPVAKAFRIVGNMPGLDDVLARRLTVDQRQQCVPIEGSMTRQSQVYPEEMCWSIVGFLRQYVQQQQPHRFCQPYQALPVQQPVADLSQWDHVASQLDITYDRSSRRPYEVGLDTDMGKNIQNLLRMDASKIQVVSNPTTRRFPPLTDSFPPTRAAFLMFSDGTRTVEMEDMEEVQFPRQRFSKAVRIGVFVFGQRRRLPPEESVTTPHVVPHMTTDIDFPGLTPTIPQEVRAAVARLHLNMGHPSRQELSRLLAYQGDVPDQVYECARKLRCATCERLKPPQRPRPSTMPNLHVGQFGDELQMDIFYGRTLKGESFKVLGIIDKATGFHQAIVPDDATSDHMFDCLEQVWFRPYGLPLRILADPDTSFRGDCQERVQALGCIMDLCPPEAHHVIGMIERRNSILRLVLEKLIDQFAASTVDECKHLLVAACHAMNSSIHSHGRSAYQAVFGRQPRLLGSNFNDPMSLATSAPTARLHEHDYAFRADLVRAEAIKAVHDLDCDRHLRRALLRKTHNTKIHDVMPGQKVAFWRWARRGGKKRGTWITGTFLSWDPSAVGKQAWVRSGGSSILVTAEQLRCAFGFEQWTPSHEDVMALKNASEDFSKHMLDDRGPPPQDPQLDDPLGAFDETQDDDLFPSTPSMMVPATPPELLQPHQGQSAAQPSTPPLPININQQQQLQQTHHYNIQLESPTHITQNILQQQQEIQHYRRFGNIPERPRHRSRTPTSKRIGQPPVQSAKALAENQAEQPAMLEQPASTAEQQRSTHTHQFHNRHKQLQFHSLPFWRLLGHSKQHQSWTQHLRFQQSSNNNRQQSR